MQNATTKDLQMISHFMCTSLNIDTQDDDVVLYIGSDSADSNLDAIVEWIEGQDGLPQGTRMEIAMALRDRLADVLFEFDSVFRMWR